MVGAAAAGAAARRAQDDLLFAFRLADATAPSRALPLRRLGIEPSPMLARLESAGVVKAGDDPVSRYLDERALRVFQSQQVSGARVVLAAVAGALALFAAGMLFFLASRR